MQNSPVTSELVRFSAAVLRRKAAELEAALSAESPAAALQAVGQALAADSLLELAEPCQRLAEGLPLYQGSTADALAGFGPEADTLRALLATHEATAAE